MAEPSAENHPDNQARPEYSADERRMLLQLAHDAVASAIEKRELDLTPPSEHLAERRGAFTTLHEKGELRGCVGYVIPMYSLYRTIAETAVAAALNDSRFAPVRADEVSRLQVEISVLSPIQAIDPEEVEVGRHGLIITYGNRRGLLLPQVSVEHKWDRETFLQQTCVKAGLPADAWEHGAKVEGFTAEVFGDEGLGA
jgi:AmmeMemoRadiSam system protein A